MSTNLIIGLIVGWIILSPFAAIVVGKFLGFADPVSRIDGSDESRSYREPGCPVSNWIER